MSRVKREKADIAFEKEGRHEDSPDQALGERTHHLVSGDDPEDFAPLDAYYLDGTFFIFKPAFCFLILPSIRLDAPRC